MKRGGGGRGAAEGRGGEGGAEACGGDVRGALVHL